MEVIAIDHRLKRTLHLRLVKMLFHVNPMLMWKNQWNVNISCNFRFCFHLLLSCLVLPLSSIRIWIWIWIWRGKVRPGEVRWGKISIEKMKMGRRFSTDFCFFCGRKLSTETFPFCATKYLAFCFWFMTELLNRVLARDVRIEWLAGWLAGWMSAAEEQCDVMVDWFQCGKRWKL